MSASQACKYKKRFAFVFISWLNNKSWKNKSISGVADLLPGDTQLLIYANVKTAVLRGIDSERIKDNCPLKALKHKSDN